METDNFVFFTGQRVRRGPDREGVRERGRGKQVRFDGCLTVPSSQQYASVSQGQICLHVVLR